MSRTLLAQLAVLLALGAAGCRSGPAPSATDAAALPATRQLGPTSTSVPPTPAPPTSTPPATLIPLAPVSADDRSIGPDDAAVTILVYSDFQCPYCAELAPVLGALRQAHPGDVRVIFRHFPILSRHDKASLAGQAAEAAGAQGKFWDMHDLLFAQQDAWTSLTTEQFQGWLVDAARDLDLDVPRFRQFIEDGRAATLMEQAFLTGLASGIPGTPFIFFNGDLLQIDASQENLEAMTRLTLLNLSTAGATPPPPAERSQPLKAFLHFDLGTVEILLYPSSAPQAVGSFVDLAKRGWYDGTLVHRVLPGRFVELGDPTGTGYGDAGYRLQDEIDPNLAFDGPGVVALASMGPNTNGSIFFITLDAMPELNGGRTIFGQAIDGLAALQNLPARDPMLDLLSAPPAILERVEVITP